VTPRRDHLMSRKSCLRYVDPSRLAAGLIGRGYPFESGSRREDLRRRESQGTERPAQRESHQVAPRTCSRVRALVGGGPAQPELDG
jgi:hypothetical protein